MSAKQQWDSRVKKWTKWAKDGGRTVQFVLWDESRLLEMLVNPVHAGRIAFWFGGPAFTAEWFDVVAVRPAVAQAGKRYTAPLHIEVSTNSSLTGLGRGRDFFDRLKNEGERLREGIEDALQFIPHIILKGLETSIFSRVGHVSLVFENSLKAHPTNFELDGIRSILSEVVEASNGAQKYLRANKDLAEKDRDLMINNISDLRRDAQKIGKYIESPEVLAGLWGRLFMKGEAGSGKTHLFCATAIEWAKTGRPVVLLLGEQFNASTEPWVQVQQLLGLQSTRPEFLGALDAIGEASGCRAVILLDGINEGVGIAYWRRYLGSMFEHLREYPNIGICISVRDAYVDDVQSVISADTAWVSHHGFHGRINEASRHFFKHYNLAEPNVPMLDPEYGNPLFLKLLCETLKARGDMRLSDPPSFSELLAMVLEDANARLAVELDYDPAERYVQRAISLLGRLMGEDGSDYLSWPRVIEECRKLKPAATRSQSLAQHLLSEDLLMRIPSMDAESSEDSVRFSYQRFSDYVVATEMLLQERAVGGTGVATLHRGNDNGEWFFPAHNWIEAIATLLPEIIGTELPLLDEKGRYAEESYRSAFFHSIVWRKRSAFSHESETCLRRLLSIENDDREEAFEALLSIAARPSHRLNANWLDSWLRSLPMADRDALWSTAIFDGWDRNRALNRLITWAWQESIAIALPKEVIRLAAITLTWMFTTSDRFVRDRATKALVSLLENNLHRLREVISHFSEIDDPYVTERLYAVAYGCVLRSGSNREIGILAIETFERFFKYGYPPASVLLRDHARGVVEAAIRREIISGIDTHLLAPPFHSMLPEMPPSDDELRDQYRYQKYENDSRGLSRIYHSVTSDDFNHYVIKDVTHWSAEAGGVSLRRSPRKLFRALLDRVKPNFRWALENLAKKYEKISWPSIKEDQKKEQLDSLKEFEELVGSVIGRFHARLFFKRLKPYLLNPRDAKYESRFSVELFERLILQRVLELGYLPSLFSDFDVRVRNNGREPYKAERIGKKYQWIAYDELHAKISDNYGLADCHTKIMADEEWSLGIWPTNHRDIDPSLLLRDTPHDGWGVNHVNWWTPHRYDAWRSKPTVIEWLQDVSDVPPIPDFIRLRDEDGESWLLLDGFHRWRRKVEAIDAWRPQRDSQELHLFICAYLVRQRDKAKIMSWAKMQNWINDLLPGASHYSHVHLFEHYNSAQFYESLDDEWIERSSPDAGLPGPVLRTSSEYYCERGTYDCSIDETIKISIPSRWIAQKLAIRPTGRNADFVDKNGRLVAFDPSTRTSGQSVLVVREDAFADMLDQEGLDVFWTLLGEKNYYLPQDVDGWPGCLTMLGAYTRTRGKIVGDFRTIFDRGH